MKYKNSNSSGMATAVDDKKSRTSDIRSGSTQDQAGGGIIQIKSDSRIQVVEGRLKVVRPPKADAA